MFVMPGNELGSCVVLEYYCSLDECNLQSTTVNELGTCIMLFQNRCIISMMVPWRILYG